MTDGQQFYTLIVFFYLLSCFKLAPLRGVAIHSRFLRGWVLREPLTSLGGLHKDLFLAPLLPWPSAAVMAEYPSGSGSLRSLSREARGDGGDSEVEVSPASTVRLIRLATRASSDLRIFSLYVFIFFLGVIPYFYMREGASPRTWWAIGLSVFFMLAAGLRFFFLHRRFAPDWRADRYKHLLFSLLMPWHAMRLSDEFLHLPCFCHVHPLVLASMDERGRGRAYIAKAVRDAVYLKKPMFELSEVKSVLKSLRIDFEGFLVPPEKDDPESFCYCPCCHTPYGSSASHCSDCEEIKLLTW